jgi:hypothetical protein
MDALESDEKEPRVEAFGMIQELYEPLPVPAAGKEPDITVLRNGDEAREFFAHAVVGQRARYYGVVHTVIDAGPEQGLRLAAIRQLEAESPQRLVAKIIALPIELLWVNGVQRKFIDSERLRALILPVPAAGSPAPPRADPPKETK